MGRANTNIGCFFFFFFYSLSGFLHGKKHMLLAAVFGDGNDDRNQTIDYA